MKNKIGNKIKLFVLLSIIILMVGCGWNDFKKNYPNTLARGMKCIYSTDDLSFIDSSNATIKTKLKIEVGATMTEAYAIYDDDDNQKQVLLNSDDKSTLSMNYKGNNSGRNYTINFNYDKDEIQKFLNHYEKGGNCSPYIYLEPATKKGVDVKYTIKFDDKDSYIALKLEDENSTSHDVPSEDATDDEIALYRSPSYVSTSLYCNGENFDIQGCLYDTKNPQKEFTDINDGKERVILNGTYHYVRNKKGHTGGSKYLLTVKSAKLEAAYTVFNDNMEAVTALCYKGYSSKEEKNYYKSFKAEYQMVDTKDSTHTLETFYLKVVAPAKKGQCSVAAHSFVFNKDGEIADQIYERSKKNDNVDVTRFISQLKKGECPLYFNYVEKADSEWVKTFGSEAPYAFGDDSGIKYKYPTQFERIISAEHGGAVIGCTETSIAEENKYAKCWDKKLENICPVKRHLTIDDITLDVSKVLKECTEENDSEGFDSAKTIDDEIEVFTNKVMDRIEKCYETACGIKDTTSVKYTDITKAFEKNTMCEHGCKITHDLSQVTESTKCYSCYDGGTAISYKLSDTKPEGSCSDAPTIEKYDCTGNKLCKACYSDAYTSAGLKDGDAKTCLLETTTEKNLLQRELYARIHGDATTWKEEKLKKSEEIRKETYIKTLFNKVYLPGLGEGSFGPSGQKCEDVFQKNGIKIIRGIVNALRILGAIIAITNAMITLVPAVISKDADGLKKAGRKLVVMAVVLAIVGILPSIVYLIGVVFGYDLSCIF